MPADERDAAIGRELARLRTAAGLTQTELSDGMRDRGWRWVQSTVWNVESGRRPIRLAEAESLAPILGVEVDALLAGGDTNPVQDLIAGLVVDLALLQRRRDDAAAQLLVAQDRRDALAGLGRAHAGEAVVWPDYRTRLQAAFSWLDPDTAARVLTYLGVTRGTAEELADRGAAFDDAAAFDLWAALRAALPTLEGPAD